jgi:hypothetical protein
MSSSDMQRLTVQRRSNVLIPSETTGQAVGQYQPTPNEQVPRSAVELFNRFTAYLDAMAALGSESISNSVNVQLEIPQLVDANMSMVSKQNTFYNQMTT